MGITLALPLYVTAQYSNFLIAQGQGSDPTPVYTSQMVGVSGDKVGTAKPTLASPVPYLDRPGINEILAVSPVDAGTATTIAGAVDALRLSERVDKTPEVTSAIVALTASLDDVPDHVIKSVLNDHDIVALPPVVIDTRLELVASSRSGERTDLPDAYTVEKSDDDSGEYETEIVIPASEHGIEQDTLERISKTTSLLQTLVDQDVDIAVQPRVVTKEERIGMEYLKAKTSNSGSNGQLSDSRLARLDSNRGQRLRLDAARMFNLMNADFTAQFGSSIKITDAYRTIGSQRSLKIQKPVLAAKPGTSNHGWGLALDLNGPVAKFNTAQYNWVNTQGRAYGWHSPSWAQQNGSKPEPWHFEFDPSLINTSVVDEDLMKQLGD